MQIICWQKLSIDCKYKKYREPPRDVQRLELVVKYFMHNRLIKIRHIYIYFKSVLKGIASGQETDLRTRL